MVMPYAVPPIFGTVRRTNEPIIPVERYAMYPYMYEDQYAYWNGARAARQARVHKPVRASAPFSLPKEARESLLKALDAAAAWLAQCQATGEELAVFTQRPSSLLTKRQVTAEGDVFGHAEDGASIEQFTVHALSVARAQRNTSFDVTPFAPSVISPGVHRLKLVSGALGERVLTVDVQPGASNIAALRKLRDAVDASELGINAELETAPQAGVVRLELRALHPGTDYSFTIEDLAGGSVVKASGIGRIAAPASNAVYTVNHGEATVSSSNEIPIRDGQVKLDLTFAPIATTIAVSVEPDLSHVAERLRSLAERMNALHAIVDQARGSLEPSFMRQIDDIMTHNGAYSVGLHRREDGAWELDEENLQAAAAMGFDDLKRQLTGRSGFVATLEEKLRLLANLPTGALINMKAEAFQPFTCYSASSQPYLQLRLSGFHVNDVL